MKSVLIRTFVLLVAGMASAQSYQFTSFFIPTALSTDAQGINDNSIVVGHFYTRALDEGFAERNGEFLPISFPGATDTWPIGINSLQQVVGWYTDSHDCRSGCGFVLSGSEYQPITYPGSVATWATSINRSGQIVGGYDDSRGDVHSFLLSGATFTSIDYPGATTTYVTGINDAGIIVGWWSDSLESNAFVLRDGNFENIRGPRDSSVNGLNNAGDLVGYSPTTSFVYHAHVLTKIGYPGAKRTVAFGINDNGVIVGVYNGGDCPVDNGHCGFTAAPMR